jgi:hypothetical protein
LAIDDFHIDRRTAMRRLAVSGVAVGTSAIWIRPSIASLPPLAAATSAQPTTGEALPTTGQASGTTAGPAQSDTDVIGGQGGAVTTGTPPSESLVLPDATQPEALPVVLGEQITRPPQLPALHGETTPNTGADTDRLVTFGVAAIGSAAAIRLGLRRDEPRSS